MAWGFFGEEHVELTDVEKDIGARIGERDVDVYATGVMSNIYRVASMMRNHMEREILVDDGLSFTAFIVMFTLWVWGDMESQRLAGKAGVTKGTLTGVVKTLERRGLCVRGGSAEDRRRVIVSLTENGANVVQKLAPLYNREESRLVDGLSLENQLLVANSLRAVLKTGSKLKAGSKSGRYRGSGESDSRLQEPGA